MGEKWKILKDKKRGVFLIFEKVMDYCKKEGLSISSFEKKCGIGNGAVSKWKDDVSKPSVATLEKIAKETKIPITEWLK